MAAQSLGSKHSGNGPSRPRVSRIGKTQSAVFNFSSRGEWYPCQNMCPHENAFLFSRGNIGSAGDTPKVSCPLHKKPFSLQTGKCLSGKEFAVKVFPVRIDGDAVLLELPPQDQLDARLATELHCVRACDAMSHDAAEPAGEVVELQTT